MRYRTLGRSGIRVSEVGYGAWAIGGGMWGPPRDEDSHAALDHAIQLGVNLVDTALAYGGGHSERLVGELLRRRDGVMVATKVPPKSGRWPARPGTPLGECF